MPAEAQQLLRLAHAADREGEARSLARQLCGEDLVVLVRDPVVQAMLPPPGFAPTLSGGPSWRELVRKCLTPGRHSADVEMPPGRWRTAQALSGGRLAILLLGCPSGSDPLAAFEPYMDLLGFAFSAEQKALAEAASAADARKSAVEAQLLAHALDAARGDASRLNAELRSEQARKDSFLAMLAHELRNPLSPLINSLDLLKLSEPAGSPVRARVDVMSRHARQLSRLVNDLLDVARVSHGRVELQRETVALSEIVRDALEATQSVIETRGHVVDIAESMAVLRVQADRTRLVQVFSNLLHNAAKYTEPGGRISVRLEQAGALARVTVSDSGIGIDAATLPHVFTLFHQAPVALARSQGGLGIGLTLARLLVELHGGRIEAFSGGTGRGSVFSVELPLSREPVPTAPSEMEPPPLAASGMRVLVVDDNEDAANALCAMLGMLGHHARTAYSGGGAVQVAMDLDAQVVFLDLGLPDIDGYQVARTLRRDMGPRCHIVALTGYGGSEHVARAREAGFSEHIVKPASMESVIAAMARAEAGTHAGFVSTAR